ncbi:MAG: hypothetical protein LBI44_02805 [Oscillospiraceae bacterium]|jgi:hypothetical protein|nr:hypothetical protein [Oscillospiraceae bacterium]
MNKLELKEATQTHVVYLYRPEGRGSYGEIRMNIGDDEAVVLSLSDGDSGAGRYAYKAAKAVKECVDRRNLPLEFTQAWY